MLEKKLSFPPPLLPRYIRPWLSWLKLNIPMLTFSNESTNILKQSTRCTSLSHVRLRPICFHYRMQFFFFHHSRIVLNTATDLSIRLTETRNICRLLWTLPSSSTLTFNVFLSALLITDEQPEVVKKQRRLEIQNRQEVYKWGDDSRFIGLPGFIKAESAKKLPKDVRFTEEAIDDLLTAKHKALVNLGLVKLLNMFEPWQDFQDYCKVSKLCQ